MAKKRSSKPAKRRDKKVGGSARRKPSPIKDPAVDIDFKDTTTLQKFVSERGKIRPRRITSLSRRHQAQMARAVKNARELSLLPYVVETVRETRAGRQERAERSSSQGDKE